jgi:hypothetical protein
MSETDPAKVLADIRARLALVNAPLDGRLLDDHRDAVIRMGESDVPRLLAALTIVLRAHHDTGGRCAWCREADGGRSTWPCGEIVAITRELTGKGT